jgi:hypothetical protein
MTRIDACVTASFGSRPDVGSAARILKVVVSVATVFFAVPDWWAEAPFATIPAIASATSELAIAAKRR